MIIDTKITEIKETNSILAFESTGDGDREWDRYLTVEGKKAYHMGNVCGTCEFYFERMSGANTSVKPKKVSEDLRNGICTLDEHLIPQLEQVIPEGNYIVLLSEIMPSLTAPNQENDYFCHEQPNAWGADTFWGMPHYPKTEYYRLKNRKFDDDAEFFEFLIPMYPKNWLLDRRINRYEEMIDAGYKPTAVSLSVLDIKTSMRSDNFITHWCLAHYLIDGHHKVYTAAKMNKPITLVSFIAIDQGVSSKEDIECMLQKIGPTINAPSTN